MKTNVGLVLLALLAAALGVALIATRHQEMKRQEADAATILDFSNQWTRASLKVEDLSQVNVALNSDLATNRAALADLSNNLSGVSQTVTNLGNSLAAAQSQMASQTARITDLQQQNKDLNDRALALATEGAEQTNRLNQLNSQIADTRRELSQSKTNNAYLETQLQELIAARADLERKFETLSALRAQTRKLEDDIYTARRLGWMKAGTLDQLKGAQLMMNFRNGVPPPSTNYGLRAEFGTDGSVRELPAGTNAPAR